MATNISIKMDVSKIDKKKLYKGEKGTYLSATLIVKDEPDQFGNCAMIVQDATKEERAAGVKGTILGNAKYISKQSNTQAPLSNKEIEDLPF